MQTEVALKAWSLMCTARAMANIYDENRSVTKYVHSTSKGHEAIQLATAFHLKPTDYAALYYRDESILLGLGMKPYELMLQLLAKSDDPFSGGRTYYGHPSLRRDGFPLIPHQSSATGMQVIPATGMAHGIAYLEHQGLLSTQVEKPLVLCSLGDGSLTEGEVSEALQMAVLKKLPIIFLVQDNEWGISAQAAEMRAMNAYEFADGFKGLTKYQVDGNDFQLSFDVMGDAFAHVREHRGPVLVHAKCSLLGHHTSGVRKEMYRSSADLEKHASTDPFDKLRNYLISNGTSVQELDSYITTANQIVKADFEKAVSAPEPPLISLTDHEFAPTPITEEVGVRNTSGDKVVMVDAALHAVEEILRKHPEALLYGQDVGGTLGGVFREAATLAQKFGDQRVFNTPIQEAYIVGSTAGMSAVGAKPIVEIQFADYIWSGVNQLVVELSKSCYLSNGQFPIQSLIRVPCGAYGGGGPYHSGCIESAILSVRGIKVVYPSNAADMKGLMKAAFYDPNPVIMFEHKGLYWSKVPGTDAAKMPEPDENYIIPLGKGRIDLEASEENLENGDSCVVITYGMGVYWAREAAKSLNGRVEVLDLRTLYPADEDLVFERVKKHGKCLVLTEEQSLNSFAEALAGRISKECFRYLDAPVEILGSVNVPAVPLNDKLEKQMLPGVDKTLQALQKLLAY